MSLFSLVSSDIAVDLGTANTFVWVRGKGIVVREPSVVARNKKTKEILAIGQKAKKMVGKTPLMIETVKPLQDGVIADFEATVAMLSSFFQELSLGGPFFSKIIKPRVALGIPSGVTEVEQRAVQDAALSAGARRAFLVEEPMAAAIGLGLPVEQPQGMLIVDIGGGTTEIALISLGGIVIDRCLRVAGDEMDEALINFIKLKYSLLLGQASAEEIKIQLGSALPPGKLASKEKQSEGEIKEKQMVIRGRDLGTGLPKSIKISAQEVREAIAPVIHQIIEQIADVIEEAPPELITDIVAKGVVLCGGGSLIEGLDKLVAEETKIPVWVADDPQTCVVQGCGKLLAEPRLLNKFRVIGSLR
ncbi:rod shape-determining protein [Candidatus Shapirobacteria bacterium]|nr:rod shape-determining protein [Candidatus Shapirobacteria bacterium]